jgi:hypothetical protein
MIQNTEKLRQILLVCPEPQLRNAFAEVVNTVISELASKERELYIEEPEIISTTSTLTTTNNNTSEDSKSSIVEQKKYKSLVIWFMETLFSLFKDARRYLGKSQQYFFIFKNFAQLGYEERNYLNRKNTIWLFLDFYVKHGEPSNQQSLSSNPPSSSSCSQPMGLSRSAFPNSGGHSATERANKTLSISSPITRPFSPPNLDNMMETVALLVRGSVTKHQNQPTRLKGPACALEDKDINVILKTVSILLK